MTHRTARHCLYTVEQARVIDAIASGGVSEHELMRRAAWAALASARRHWPQAQRLAVHCGPGNNGGDGFLLATLAREVGLAVEVIALVDESRGEARNARQGWLDSGGSVSTWTDVQALSTIDLASFDLHVDALFGIGLHRAPDAVVSAWIEAIRASGVPVLALDVPSGLAADTGACPGVAMRADVTVSMIVAKRGLYTGQASAHVGVPELDALGVCVDAAMAGAADCHLLDAQTLPRRARDEHKGDNGHVLAIGGDHGTAGAIRLCGEAALRAGAGLVSVATRGTNLTALNSARPELMAHAVDGRLALLPLLDRASVLAVGPGLGTGAWSHALWLAALAFELPLVLDADGLNLLSKTPRRFQQPAVLTPHPGEAARLLESSIANVEADRFAAARTLAKRFNAVVVLKGAGTLIADVDGRLDVCPWGNPGMAAGGMGDLLTGIIAALLGQGCTAWEAACLGVALHARAGDCAAAQGGERGLLPSDLLLPLRHLLNGIHA